MEMSSLKDRVIININNGEKLGILGYCDLKIDEKEGKIISLLIPKRKFKMFFPSDSDYIEIPWEAIVKIGMDTIMVNI